jgi:hypothetical protein
VFFQIIFRTRGEKFSHFTAITTSDFFGGVLVPVIAINTGIPIIVKPVPIIFNGVPEYQKIVTFFFWMNQNASARMAFVRVVRTVVAIDRAVNVVHGDYLLDFVNSL